MFIVFPLWYDQTWYQREFSFHNYVCENFLSIFLYCLIFFLSFKWPYLWCFTPLTVSPLYVVWSHTIWLCLNRRNPHLNRNFTNYCRDQPAELRCWSHWHIKHRQRSKPHPKCPCTFIKSYSLSRDWIMTLASSTAKVPSSKRKCVKE